MPFDVPNLIVISENDEVPPLVPVLMQVLSVIKLCGHIILSFHL